MIKVLIAGILCGVPLLLGADQKPPESAVRVTKLSTPVKALKFEVMIPL